MACLQLVACCSLVLTQMTCPFNSHISPQPDPSTLNQAVETVSIILLSATLFSDVRTLQMLMTISLVLLAQSNA